MPSIIGRTSEEKKEYIEEELVEEGRFDQTSEAVEHLIDYALYHKYDYEE